MWQSMSTNNCNAYFIDGPSRVLIDPGHRALFEHVQRGLEDLNLSIQDIDVVICTHAHPDHLEAVPIFKDTPALFTMHETEWQWAANIGKHMSASFGIDINDLRPDFFLTEGNLSLNGLDLDIIHTPGHSPGSVSLYWPQQKALFTGDLIFKEGVGRTDLPGGDGSQLKESIKGLNNLDVEWLLSGHGDVISGSDNVKKNFENVESFYFAYV
ncbi:MAG: MBL fold metallo-hydrolase [bacterium]|nr:MBL fold metallo-hydrolase [bacterium]